MSMPDPFSNPQSGFVKLQDYADHALIVTPRQIVHGITTSKSKSPGDTSAADVDAVVLYADGTVKELPNLRVFGKGLVAQFGRSIGQMVIGRISMEKSTNGNDVWIMGNATDEDRALGIAYLTAKANGQLKTAPAAQPQMAGAAAGGSAPKVDPFA
ncbi:MULTISPECIES: hypothetical protein [unclassified Nonomuraea]|uniref:hypothetical protein n=1 Tax=unclassified Nonomuraea TaxID=2593643 RepID=UPI0033C8E5EE